VVREAVFAIPGELATPTGGYAYDRRIIAELPAQGWRAAVLGLGDGFPHPGEEVRTAAAARLAAQDPGHPLVVDGLAFGTLPEVARALSRSHRLVAVVHHPLALETGLAPSERDALRASEREALAGARRVVAVSDATARLLCADYAVAPERIRVVSPGTDRVMPRSPRPPDGTIRLLAVGSVVPRKGYDVLVAALGRIRHLPWRLVIAGDRGRHPPTAARLAADIAALGLTDRIELRGALLEDALGALYAASDLFVLPSHHEGYGMAYAEAMVHGLPVIGTTAGAIPETVPPQAGVLVPPDDVAALAAALRELIESAPERERLAAGARAARFPTWPEQARLFARVLDDLP
jgi:glycosyltransferase involved in cell wall biosynthesis